MVGININLNSSQDAQIKKDDELIQQDSKNRLIKIFKEYRNLLDNTNIDIFSDITSLFVKINKFAIQVSLL